MNIRISVVIPTYRRPDLLARCLMALDQQDLDASLFEILVCDDAVDANTYHQIENWARLRDASPVPLLRYVPSDDLHRGPAAARNRGWRAAFGDIIAFTDDDCIPAPDWLSQGLAVFDQDPNRQSSTPSIAIAALSGHVHMSLPPDPTDYELDAARLSEAEFVTANCFCKRAVLEAVGGFDERFHTAWREDSDLQFTLMERGYRIEHAPQAIVVHPVRPAPWGVGLSMERKGLYEALLYKKHPILYRQRIRSRPLWNYYGMVVALLGLCASALNRRRLVMSLASGLWLSLAGEFALQRLAHTSRRPSHIAEMALTSAGIPVLSVFWTLVGAIKYRVFFL